MGVFGAVFNVSLCFNLSQYIVDDGAVEGREVFTVRLVVTNGSIDTAAIYIVDNDGKSKHHSILLADIIIILVHACLYGMKKSSCHMQLGCSYLRPIYM